MRTPVHPRTNSEEYFWNAYEFRVQGHQLQVLQFHSKGGNYPENGWYIHHVRPATGQEQNMYDHIREEVRLQQKE